MRTYNINDGLVCNQIRGFYQDKKGFIWVLTWEGLSRYDGGTFRNYTVSKGLAHPLINAMIEGRDDRMYIAENDGTIDVILHGEICRELRTSHKTAINKFLRQPSGTILAPSDEIGICVFDENMMTPLNRSGSLVSANDVIADEEHFFVCGAKSGFMRHDHTFLKVWSETNGEYLSIAEDQQRRIWVGTVKGLRWVSRLPGPEQNDVIRTTFDDHAWAGWIIRDILCSTDGSIWLAATGGLVQIRKDHTWRIYNRNDGLPADFVTSLFEDKAGFLWIGTDQGMAKLDIKNPIDIFTITGDMSNNVVKDILLTEDGGSYIISNTGAVFRITQNQALRNIDSGSSRGAFAFMVMGMDTLVSTETGQYQIVNNAFTTKQALPYKTPWLSVPMNDSCIFSSNNDRIMITSPTNVIVDSAINNTIYVLSPGGANDVWIGTLNDGVYQARIKESAVGKMEVELKDFNALMPEKTIRSIHADARGNIWVGTRYSGLVRLYHDTLTGGYVTDIFDRQDGFISDFIKSISSDHGGNVWVGTNAGIEKLIPVSNGFRTFSFSRVHNYFGTITKLVTDENQTVWCTTTAGVARIRDGRYDTIPPSEVFITSVTTADTILLDPEHLLPFELNYHQNFIDIAFASNDLINGELFKYSYHLVGSQDTSWSKPQPVRNVTFANLLPGAYSFEVRVQGWNGIPGSKTTYQFSILPPFWRQTWFLLLSVGVFLALLYAFYRYRVMQLKRVQMVRDRIASDLHDEIGSSLTHVNILSEIGQISKEASQPQNLFKRIGEEAQSSAEALDDIIWSVSSRVDTAEDLISRMRRYASELFDTKGISFTLHEDQVDQHLQLGLELRRDFYLIYKEVLRNIIRHAEATKVDVNIRREHHILWMVIADNGRGFDPDAQSDRQGLHSIRNRVGKWRGQISIDSSSTAGTKVSVGLPVRSGIAFQKRRNHSKE